VQGGTNLFRVRDYNRQLVLQAIREGSGASRVELADKTGLTTQTISNIVRRLMAEGLVVEVGKGASQGGGKPRIKLRINANARYSVGVQIDRDETSFALLDLDGRVVERAREATPLEQGPSRVVDRVAHSVERLIEEAGVSRGKILGLGVGCPGPLDPSSGIVYKPPGMLGWEETRLKEMLEERTGQEVIVDNDAVAAAVGERWMGRARGARNFVFVYMGWGMGAGLFVEGQVYRGSTGTAGEIGHVPLDPEGPECPCGNRGCLIRYCSPREIVAAVERRLRQGETSVVSEDSEAGTEGVKYGALCQAALAGEAVAAGELERSGRMLGSALVGLTNVLDLELVVLGGKALREAACIYKREVEKALKERVLYRDRRKVRVELSTAGEDAGAVGAASLVLHMAYAPQMTGLRAVV
jgi:predicted NBD/HSP70 family sugar kinase